MNNDFPRIVTLLRKERGLSQKQAALELGVSQALLSHYEKGIRECGLDFVIKIADYYQVSCDYLLGRSLDRTGSAPSAAPDTEQPLNAAKDENHKTAALTAMNKKLILNSLQIIFDILEEIDNKGLTSEVSSYFMISVYKMLRSVYSLNQKNPQAMFSVIPEYYAGIASALQNVVEANINGLSLGKASPASYNVDSSAVPYLSPEVISKSHPDTAPALYNLIRDTEEKMKRLL